TSDLLVRPPLPAASQRPSLACSARSLSALLADHDGGDDAAIQYAHGQAGGVCWSQARTSRRGPLGVPGWLCRDLDGICWRSLSRGYAAASSGGTVAVVGSACLAHRCSDVLHRRSVLVQSPQGAL